MERTRTSPEGGSAWREGVRALLAFMRHPRTAIASALMAEQNSGLADSWLDAERKKGRLPERHPE